MPKRCGPVVLDEKVRNPRKRVRNHESQRTPPPLMQCQHRAQCDPTEKSTDAVENARRRLTMRADVLRPKFLKRHGNQPYLAPRSLRGALHHINAEPITRIPRKSLGNTKGAPNFGAPFDCLTHNR